MSFRHSLFLATTLAICIAILAPGAASAGTISLAWDPVSHADLVGYRVYYGQTPGNYGQPVDVGLTPEVTLSGLASCIDYYVAVKARGSDGSESPAFSSEISGWARPEVASVSPGAVERNSQVDLTVAGTNFRTGATVQLSNPGLTVNNVSVNGCSQLVVNVSVGSTAPLGNVDIEVVNPDQVFGAASALFSVIADSAPPSLSSLQAVNVGSTEATITWSTDEPADSQVFFRRAGETVYQQTGLDSNLVTGHQTELTGLSPDTTYEYYVRSADASGNAATSSPDQTFITAANSYVYLRIEAESGDLASPIETTQAAGAFRGAWISTPSGTPAGNSNNPAGTATFGVHVPSSGTWHYWFRIYGPSASNNSWYEEVDGGGLSQITTAQEGVWQWIAGRSYSLSTGLHTLTVGGRENQTRMDRILITDDPGFVPSEQPGADLTPPAQVSALGAAPSDGVNSMSWNNPGSSDLDRVVVRFRTDGSHPQSPADGLPLFDQSASPNTAESLVHSGLTNGTTYYYSVFAIDTAGNASDPAMIQSTPEIETPPLGQVHNVHRTDTSGP